jgi:3-oxoacyl-[acyl-carrier protein] reductase
MSRLDSKVAIVTGGASGFGMGIVRHFVAAGARVLVADLDEQKGGALAEELGGASRVEFLRVDVTKPEDVAAMVATAQSLLGGLDVLVNNAGLGQRPVRLEETTDEVYDTLFDVNVRSVFLCCRIALPVFRRQGHGNIINTASGIALTPRPNLVAYGAAKGAVVTFTKGLAMELAEDGIRVNALCPAAGDTPMLAEFMGGEETEAGRSRFTASVPMGRLISPDDMGAAAVFLASDEAAMVTGTCLPVDGGRCI